MIWGGLTGSLPAQGSTAEARLPLVPEAAKTLPREGLLNSHYLGHLQFIQTELAISGCW